jgi:acetoin utilization protein AcuB
MLVRDILTPGVLTIAPETTLPEAVRLARERGVRHLPVVENGKLVGIISDRDLKQAMASPATSLDVHELKYLLDRLAVGEIMTRAVITIGPLAPVEDAARLMVVEKISALPVTDGDRLVGIVTETDVLNLFLKAMGASQPSSRLDVALDDRPGALGEILRVIEATGVSVSSVMTLVDRGGQREAVIRLATIQPGPAVQALTARGYAVRQPWHA